MLDKFKWRNYYLLRKTLQCHNYNQLRPLHKNATSPSVPKPNTFNMFKNEEAFQKVLPEVMNSLMTGSKLKNQLPEVRSWVKYLLDYTMSGGKKNTGLSVPFAYEMMEEPQYFTEEKLQKARFLGWCVEMVQIGILVVDDIIDVSTTRRGKPCWYLQPNVGTSAVNDCLFIQQCVMEVLEINFGKAPFYTDLIKRVNETLMYTCIGQYLDHISGYSKEKNNIDGFTMERFNTIAVQKVGYFAFGLPMFVALLLAKNGRDRDITELSSICFEFGKLLQIQNDFEDIWDEATLGKAGTDIQEGKLSWISVTALERCNEAQRSIFKEYYGSKDPEHVKRIKQLYGELRIDKLYKNFKSSVLKSLERRIYALPTEGEAQYCLGVLEGIRQKIY